jgi:hypothetical protein
MPGGKDVPKPQVADHRARRRQAHAARTEEPTAEGASRSSCIAHARRRAAPPRSTTGTSRRICCSNADADRQELARASGASRRTALAIQDPSAATATRATFRSSSTGATNRLNKMISMKGTHAIQALDLWPKVGWNAGAARRRPRGIERTIARGRAGHGHRRSPEALRLASDDVANGELARLVDPAFRPGSARPERDAVPAGLRHLVLAWMRGSTGRDVPDPPPRRRDASRPPRRVPLLFLPLRAAEDRAPGSRRRLARRLVSRHPEIDRFGRPRRSASAPIWSDLRGLYVVGIRHRPRSLGAS